MVKILINSLGRSINVISTNYFVISNLSFDSRFQTNIFGIYYLVSLWKLNCKPFSSKPYLCINLIYEWFSSSKPYLCINLIYEWFSSSKPYLCINLIYEWFSSSTNELHSKSSALTAVRACKQDTALKRPLTLGVCKYLGRGMSCSSTMEILWLCIHFCL